MWRSRLHDRKIQFTSGTRIGDFDFTFSVPKAVVLGLLSVVILHPANKDETASVGASIRLGGTHHYLNDIWGTGLSVVGVPSAQVRAARIINTGVISIDQTGEDDVEAKPG
jgi:hypothetical protein